MKTTVWLADLTHTGQSIASDSVPAGIGMLAEALHLYVPSLDELRLFKFPENLATAIESETPRILGFSNYVWNYQLSRQLGGIIKTAFPDVVTVMGGPNFPTDETEQKIFFSENNWLDFYVVKEGEKALADLVNALIENRFDPLSVDPCELSNVLALRKGAITASNRLERVQNLNTIPSPYLSGRLDVFLDGRLMPVIQTNRGCPFSCAFCTEGQLFWNKVRKKSSELIAAEIKYIAGCLKELPLSEQRGDLLIADSNFGMFSEDLETCDVIRSVQKDDNYPTYINVATGKNKKERVLEAARRVNGAMKLAGSVQSLDPEVQKNMRRSNISTEQIVSLALQASEIGANTYSEVILALPGDTKEKHVRTLRTLVDADFSTISMYQLMVLPGTEFGEAKVKQQYAMQTRFRVIPRAFGQYHILNYRNNIAEIEEVCIANSTLSYEDYLGCRRLNLIVNIFFNDRIFHETLQTLKWAKLSVFDLLLCIAETRHNDSLERLISSFLRETEGELWTSFEELNNFVADTQNMQKFIDGTIGSNLIFKYKALSLTTHLDGVCEALDRSIEKYVSINRPNCSPLLSLLKETVSYKRLQVKEIFTNEEDVEGIFSFPIHKLAKVLQEHSPESLGSQASKTKIVFQHSTAQRDMILSYKKIFGDDIVGVSRILTRARLTEFYRAPVLAI
jgi:radical SAM superfamily enzyme YgiQ (UPF0313 family)